MGMQLGRPCFISNINRSHKFPTQHVGAMALVLPGANVSWPAACAKTKPGKSRASVITDYLIDRPSQAWLGGRTGVLLVSMVSHPMCAVYEAPATGDTIWQRLATATFAEANVHRFGARGLGASFWAYF